MLGTLDRSRCWRLWFDPVGFRWELEDLGEREGGTTPTDSEAEEGTALPDVQCRPRWVHPL
jgi:hypothetical protein